MKKYLLLITLVTLCLVVLWLTNPFDAMKDCQRTYTKAQCEILLKE